MMSPEEADRLGLKPFGDGGAENETSPWLGRSFRQQPPANDSTSEAAAQVLHAWALPIPCGRTVCSDFWLHGAVDKQLAMPPWSMGCNAGPIWRIQCFLP